MPITLKQAKQLQHGDILYHRSITKSDGTPQRWRVNGMPKLWRTDPKRIKVPLKYGLYAYGELTNGTIEGNQYTFDLSEFELNESKITKK